MSYESTTLREHWPEYNTPSCSHTGCSRAARAVGSCSRLPAVVLSELDLCWVSTSEAIHPSLSRWRCGFRHRATVTVIAVQGWWSPTSQQMKAFYFWKVESKHLYKDKRHLRRGWEHTKKNKRALTFRVLTSMDVINMLSLDMHTVTLVIYGNWIPFNRWAVNLDDVEPLCHVVRTPPPTRQTAPRRTSPHVAHLNLYQDKSGRAARRRVTPPITQIESWEKLESLSAVLITTGMSNDLHVHDTAVA